MTKRRPKELKPFAQSHWLAAEPGRLISSPASDSQTWLFWSGWAGQLEGAHPGARPPKAIDSSHGGRLRWVPGWGSKAGGGRPGLLGALS